MEFYLGFDLGTSAIKGTLVSEDGKIAATARRPTVILSPKPGWREFSLSRYYGIFCEAARELSEKVPPGGRIRALGISGAAGSTVLLGKGGKPLCDAVSWTDTRTADDPSLDPKGISLKEIHQITGWPWSRIFPMAHLAWFRKNKSGLLSKADKIGMDITYVLYRLTGKWVMDFSCATNFYLMDQVKRAWHSPFLRWFGIKEKQLPELFPSGTSVGGLTEEACRDTGLRPDTAAVLGAFDHPSAARGTSVLKEGELLLSCGTSWVGFYPAKDRKKILSLGLLCDPFLSPKGPWGAIFSLPRVGERVDAIVKERFPCEPSMARRYARFNEEAKKSAPGSGEPCRALMEGLCVEMKSKMDELSAAGFSAKRIVMVGGPSESPVWPGILEKMTGLKVDLPESGSYAGALGAAFLAGAKRKDVPGRVSERSVRGKR